MFMLYTAVDMESQNFSENKDSKENSSSKVSINDDGDPDDGLDFDKQFANYKIKMMRSKKYLDKIHL